MELNSRVDVRDMSRARDIGVMCSGVSVLMREPIKLSQLCKLKVMSMVAWICSDLLHYAWRVAFCSANGSQLGMLWSHTYHMQLFTRQEQTTRR
jgi:hypothetical protein